MNGFLMALAITASFVLPLLGACIISGILADDQQVLALRSPTARRKAVALAVLLVLLGFACAGFPYSYAGKITFTDGRTMGLILLGICHAAAVFAVAGIIGSGVEKWQKTSKEEDKTHIRRVS